MTQEMKEKLDRSKAMLGTTYLLHPANQVKRKTPFRKTSAQLRAGLRSSIWVNVR